VPILKLAKLERRVKQMQIHSNWTTNQPMINELPFSLNEGDTIFAVVKERLNNNEAILTIKGQDVHVRFQGDMPTGDKLAVQITGIKDHILEVQAAPQIVKPQAAESLFGGELERAEQLLLAQGVRLTKQDKAILKRFFEKAKGTWSEKLETLQALISKKLQITETHLQAIHEALHGESFGDVLTQLTEQLNFFFDVEVLEEHEQNSFMKENKSVDTLSKSQIMNDEASPSQAEVESLETKAASEQPSGFPYLNEEWFNGMPAQTKDIIVRTVTEKLAQVTFEFKKLQREIQQKLENAKIFLVNTQPQARQQAKQFIEAVIHTLDRAILHGEFMLFTDMKTEKQLLQASAKLAEAKQLLTAGKQSDALTIVREVKNVLEGLRFQPADVKVKHFISELNVNQQLGTPEKQLVAQMTKALQLPLNEEVSARNAFEQLRKFGFHHEKDLARAWMFKQPMPQTENIKALLMKVSQGEFGGLAARQAEQAVANITGQQLLSKFDGNNHMQTMFYQLPLLMQDKIETVNVYLNSRNEGGKLDWQNCSLYFLLDTEKYGKVGILLQAVERNLTLTIKTDHEKLSETLKPLTEAAKENLEAIGYRVKGIHFTKLNEQEEQKTVIEPTQVKETTSEKGYDVIV
jgi:hypothetical protein